MTEPQDIVTDDQLHREIAAVKDLLHDKVDARHREMLDASKLFEEKLTALTLRIDAMEAARREWKADQQRAIDAALQSVKEANDVRANALATEFHEHLVQYRRETDMAFDAAHKGVEAALANTDKANSKAEAANEKRFESVNEFRAQLADIIRTLIPRAEHDAELKALEQQIGTVKTDLNKADTRITGIEKEKQGGVDARSAIFATIGIVGTLLIIMTVLAANGVLR